MIVAFFQFFPRSVERKSAIKGRAIIAICVQREFRATLVLYYGCLARQRKYFAHHEIKRNRTTLTMFKTKENGNTAFKQCSDHEICIPRMLIKKIRNCVLLRHRIKGIILSRQKLIFQLIQPTKITGSPRAAQKIFCLGQEELQKLQDFRS